MFTRTQIWFITIIFIILYNACSFAIDRIDKITIEGNTRIEKSTIENYLGLKMGDSYDLLKQSTAIKNLFSTSLFEDIAIKYIAGNLIVRVVEPPLVSKIEFVGNSKIKKSALSKELLTQVGDSLSKSNIQSDTEKIKEMYKISGRFLTTVRAVTQPQENNRIKVIFSISEGPKTGIKNIYFIGNENYRDGELKSVILTKESRWFRFLETNDAYDPNRIEYDKELLKTFYQSVGFADFAVISATAELAQTKEYFTVTYSMDEGPKYNLGDITIDNKLPNIDEAVLLKLISIKKGQVFNMQAIDNVSETITAYLASAGYPQIVVSVDTSNRTNNVINVKFVIDHADRIFIRNIDIEGNLKTYDKVIRREFRIAEGDIFNRSYIEKGEHNLRNLDYFEKIYTQVKPTHLKDKYDVHINVEEKSTSSVGFDLGYNTAGGAFGRLSFIERNLIGTGKYLTGGIQMGRKNTSYYAGLTEPHFLDRDLSLSGNIFRNYSGRSGGFGQVEQNYTLKSIGLKTSLSYDIATDLTHEVDYTIKNDHLSAPIGSNPIFIQEQIGKFTTSAIGQTFIYDKTDSRIIPKNGYILSVSQEYAGLGGNTKYLKHEGDTKYFKSFNHNKLTLKIAGSVGDIRGVSKQKSLRISDRFNLGDYTLRGFTFGGVGPRDKKTSDSLGGQQYYTFGTELNFPIGLPEELNVTGAAFCDIGSLWKVELKPSTLYTKQDFWHDKSLRASAGLGVIWITRIAPIRIDWALPIKKKPYDDTQRFHIRFSTHF